MKMKHGLRAAALLGACLAFGSADAARETKPPVPFAISLLPCDWCQLPFSDRSVEGLRLDLLFGRHRNVSWLDIGTLANVATERATGLQIALVNSAKTLTGLQIGLVNHAADSSEGLQIGLVNVMPGARFPICPILNVGFSD